MKIMAHTVIAYPDLESTKVVCEKYIAAGMEILELQIPFSHPTADGSILTQANRLAAKEISTSGALDFVEELKTQHPDQKVMLMSYVNKIFSFGIQNFISRMKKMKVPYLIIPDLPFDSPLAQKFHEDDYVQLIPVLSANTFSDRLKLAMSSKPDYVYLMADFKITGSQFSLHENIKNLIGKIKELHPAKVGLGFGISNAEQVNQCLEIADFSIIGSALTKACDEGRIDGILKEFQAEVL